MLTDEQARALGACVAAGGVAVFPADTVYGLACDPENADAVAKLYALKGRPPAKPAAVMFFDLAAAPDVGPYRALLPGGVTLLVPNPERRYPLAGGEALGVRVPFLAPVGRPVLQSSANLAGGPDARRLDEVPASIRAGADLVLDGGELPGTPSTVIDVHTGAILREGAVPRALVQQLVDAQLAADDAEQQPPL
ncbi:MAG TPA: Sua5/YciO/YrdC/YwlC family protein [Solirubrobacter sp.]|nr:Sua5/YciO/YrdC/YwlC family protein [Solirubrobacter sp.]